MRPPAVSTSGWVSKRSPRHGLWPGSAGGAAASGAGSAFAAAAATPGCRCRCPGPFRLLTLCFAEYPGCFTDPHDDLPDLVRPGHWPERRDAGGRPLGGAFLVLDDARAVCAHPWRMTCRSRRGRIAPALRASGLPPPQHRGTPGPPCRAMRTAGWRALDLALVGHRFVSAHQLYQGLGYAPTGATRELHDISALQSMNSLRCFNRVVIGLRKKAQICSAF